MTENDDARLGNRDRVDGDPLRRRQAIAYELAAVSETGQVAVVYGGMDCDCVVFRNRVCILPAHILAYERFVRGLLEDREGPIWFGMEKPSVATTLAASQRDLAMEAFENGHPGNVDGGSLATLWPPRPVR